MFKPDGVVADAHKPSKVSVSLVLAALLVIIPGFCFGVLGGGRGPDGIPRTWQDHVALYLGLSWFALLFVLLIVLLLKAVRFIARSL